VKGLAGVEVRAVLLLPLTNGTEASCLKEELLLLGAESDRFSSAVISTVFSGLGSFKLRFGADLLLAMVSPRLFNPDEVSLAMDMEEGRRFLAEGLDCLDLDLTDDILSLLPFFVSGQHLLASHPAAIVETGFGQERTQSWVEVIPPASWGSISTNSGWIVVEWMPS